MFCWVGQAQARRRFFAGKHVLIAGASSGIGREIALQLAEDVGVLSLVARGKDRLNNVVSECREVASKRALNTNGKSDPGETAQSRVARTQICAVACDCSDPAAVDDMVAHVESENGPVHVLINAAGGAHGVYFENLSSNLAEAQMKGNYFSQLYPARAIFARMKSNYIRGNIVFVSSMAGLTGVFGLTAYAPAKFAIRGLAECLFYEGLSHGIQITVVYPPDTNTDGYASERATMPAETLEISGSAGLFEPDEVARQVVRGIVRGQYRVMVGFEGKLLGIVTAGMTPSSSWAEFCLMSSLRAVSRLFVRNFKRIILRHHATRISQNSTA